MRRDKGKASNVTSALPAATSNIMLQEKRIKNQNENSNEDENKNENRNKNNHTSREDNKDATWKYLTSYDLR